MNINLTKGNFGKFSRMAAIGTATASVLLVDVPTSPPMYASPANRVDATTSASCDIRIGRTYQNGNYIYGYGSIASGCSRGSRATLRLQRSRWYGWEDMKSVTVDGTGYDQYVSYNCAGTGKHEFRTIIMARMLTGNYLFKESNHITASC